METRELSEQRAELYEKLNALVNTAKAETRALTEDEQTSFDELEKSIKNIDETIEKERRAMELENKNVVPLTSKKSEDEVRAQEEAAFCDLIRGTITAEQRADVNMTTSDNGAVIPTTIANKIIEKVKEICPVFQLADRYNVKGTLAIPYVDDATNDIKMAYATEFTDLESNSNKFSSIELKGYLAGALTKVSKSLINNSNFDLLTFVINHMAANISQFIEGELLNGTTSKVAGLSEVTSAQTVTAASSTTLTADELIDVQEKVPDKYQADAIWIMSKATRTAIRKLKDGQDNYLLNKDATSKWGYTLFNKPVYVSDKMSDMAAGKLSIYYGDMSGLAVNLPEDVTIDVLREKFATQHAVGVVGWVEFDAKIENAQKIAALKMKATA